jgi:hypothetical protein
MWSLIKGIIKKDGDARKTEKILEGLTGYSP